MSLRGPALTRLCRPRTDIRRVSLDQREMREVVNSTSAATAVDYDFRAGRLYWSDAADRAIYR